MSDRIKRREFTIHEKLQIIDDLKSKKYTRNQIREMYKCGKSSISRIVMAEDRLRKIVNPERSFRTRVSKGSNSVVSEAVTQWYHTMKDHMFINGPILKKQAMKFAELLNVETFCASNGWLCRWQKNNNVTFKTKDIKQPKIVLEESSEMSMIEADNVYEDGFEDEVEVANEVLYSRENTPVMDSLQDIDNGCLSEKQGDLARDKSNKSTTLEMEIVRQIEIAERTRNEANKIAETECSIKFAATKAMDVLLDYMRTFNVKSLDDAKESLLPGRSSETVSDDDQEDSSVASCSIIQDTDANQHNEGPPKKMRRIDDKIDQTTTAPSDQFSVYGENVACRLRNCERNKQEVFIAQHNIDDILFKLSMGVYSQKSSGHKTNSNESSTFPVLVTGSITRPVSIQPNYILPTSDEGSHSHSQLTVKDEFIL